MTVCELYPGVDVYEPMLISKQPSPEKIKALIATKNYIAQPKKDGFFYSLYKGVNGETYLFSRSKSKKTNFYSEKIACVPHIKEWSKQLPNDTILIGEIYYPGGKSNDVTKIMGCLPATAIRRQNTKEYGLIHYYIHDIIKWDGNDFLSLGFQERYSNLCKYIDSGCENPYYIEIAPSKTGYDTYECILDWIAAGEEGAVLKAKDGLYQPGKRPSYNIKIKQQLNDVDLVVMELLDPTKEYTGDDPEHWPYTDESGNPVTKHWFFGWKNAFEVGAYKDGKLVKIGQVASGFTDELREDCALHPEKYLGQVVELQAMQTTEDGALRHPVFKRMRPDKQPQDCVWEEIFK